MANKKPASKAKGAKTLGADKASQVKGGVTIRPSPTQQTGDGSVKLNPGVRVIDFE